MSKFKYAAGLMLLVMLCSLNTAGCGVESAVRDEGLGLNKQAPSFTLPEYLTGREVNFPADYKGRKVLVFFLSFG